MKRHKTPPLANFLLRLFCREQYLEEVEGDLEETFDWRIQEKGVTHARFRYYLDVFSAIRLFSLGKIGGYSILPDMLLSFAKSSLRTFYRNKAYSVLNICGLAMAMTATLYILEYVSDELNYDRFSQSDQMYRISQDFVKNNERVYKTAVTGAPVAPATLRDLPKVEKAARLLDYTRIWNGKNIFMLSDNQEKKFAESAVYFTDPAILDIFDLKILLGVSRLEEPNTLMLSEEMAIKYFGNAEKAIGQVITFVSVSNKPSLLVTGVYRLPAFNMQVSPSVLISHATLIDAFGQVGPHQMWGVNSSLTYVKLQEGVTQSELESDLAALLLKYNPLETPKEINSFRTGSLMAMPIKDIHLQSTYLDEVGKVGNLNMVKTLIIVAIFIMIIAWVNYINMATAHALTRLKGLGIRKVMGAKKGEIIAQFFVEAFLINAFALFLAFALVWLGQEFFNYQIDKTLSIEGIDWFRFGWPTCLFFIVGVFFSGLYPLTVFFSLSTVTALIGKSQSNAGSKLRKGLIVFQFLASTLLIMATLSINRQLDFMTTTDLGINAARVLILDGPTLKENNRQQRQRKTALLIDQLRQLPNISDVGVSNNVPGNPVLQSHTVSRFASADSPTGQFEVVAGHQYLDVLEVKFLAGGGFTKTENNVEDVNQENERIPQIILSESASRKLGFGDPHEAIGQQIYRRFRDAKPMAATVVGVVGDYHHEPLKSAIDPMIFYEGRNWDNHYLIKLATHASMSTLAEIEKTYQSIYPEDPVNFFYLDEYMARQYRSEEVNGKVFSAFATIAIVVACLGLFGLSSFIALQRTKEIGIRKVMGAGADSVFLLLTKQLLLLASLGFLIATPLGYYGINRWLEGFAYRISISPSLFLLPLVIILILATLAISPRVLKTALMDPVKSLRYE